MPFFPAPAPEKTATQDEDEEALTIADARRTIERCTTLARADLDDEECDSPRGNFRLVLSFDLAVTPADAFAKFWDCLVYTSPSPRDRQKSRMPSSA